MLKIADVVLLFLVNHSIDEFLFTFYIYLTNKQIIQIWGQLTFIVLNILAKTCWLLSVLIKEMIKVSPSKGGLKKLSKFPSN